MKVSLIIPVYNVEKYIERCIRSIINQSYRDVEIILVDDGSDDESSSICDKYASLDLRINVIHKQNGGLSSARNVGLKHASGDVVGFVDSDDYIEKNMVEVLVKPIQEYDVDISVCGWYVIRNGERKLSQFRNQYGLLTDEGAIELLLSYGGFDNFACNKLYKRNLFDDILFPDGKVLEDLAVMYKLINRSSKVFVNSESLYNYDIHVESITSNLSRQIRPEVFNIYYERKCDLLKMYPRLKTRICENYFMSCRSNYLIAVASPKRYRWFEKYLIKEMRKNYFYMLKDHEVTLRMKLGSVLLICLPKIYVGIKNG